MLLGSRNYRIRDRRGKTALAALSEALTGFSLAAAIALALSNGQPWAESIFTNSRGLYLHTPIAGHLPLPATQVTRIADDALKPPSQEPTPAAGAENKPVSAPEDGKPGAAPARDTVAKAAAALPVALPPAGAPKAPPAVNKNLIPAKELFGAVSAPAAMASKAIGFYANGCLAGAKPLPASGPAWQVMRLSRNRNWGHPSLVKFIERLAEDARAKDGWPGLLVGDMSQARGGPLPSGHASHQVGLDVDIWYRPMPDRELSKEERESAPMDSILSDPTHVNPQVWNESYEKLLRRAASYPEVARIFVHPAIKKALCDGAGKDRAFLHKIEPYWGHDDHFHIRLVCPGGDSACRNQPPLPNDEGCGKGLDKWLKMLARPSAKPAPQVTAKKRHVKPPLTLAQLPSECRAVLSAPPSNQTEVTVNYAK